MRDTALLAFRPAMGYMRPMNDAPLYVIIGHPLAHTMSPPLHTWALAQAGLPGRFTARPTEPGLLADFMVEMRERPISGASVTIPHKLAVMEYLDEITDLARSVGAVNTLFWKNDALCGHNTDAEGFAHPLLAMPRPPSSALVLGAGGAARAVLAGLGRVGVQRVFLTNRSPDKAEALAAEFRSAIGAKAVPWDERGRVDAELLVNTTPMGMAGDHEDESPLPEGHCLSPNQIVYDVVYIPLRTRLLRQAEDSGCRTIDGLSMFVHQAVGQFRLFTGHEMDPTGARRLVMGLLGQ